jgi:hypothetical protein
MENSSKKNRRNPPAHQIRRDNTGKSSLDPASSPRPRNRAFFLIITIFISTGLMFKHFRDSDMGKERKD